MPGGHVSVMNMHMSVCVPMPGPTIMVIGIVVSPAGGVVFGTPFVQVAGNWAHWSAGRGCPPTQPGVSPPGGHSPVTCSGVITGTGGVPPVPAGGVPPVPAGGVPPVPAGGVPPVPGAVPSVIGTPSVQVAGSTAHCCSAVGLPSVHPPSDTVQTCIACSGVSPPPVGAGIIGGQVQPFSPKVQFGAGAVERSGGHVHPPPGAAVQSAAGGFAGSATGHAHMPFVATHPGAGGVAFGSRTGGHVHPVSPAVQFAAGGVPLPAGHTHMKPWARQPGTGGLAGLNGCPHLTHVPPLSWQPGAG
ncbi:MAG: hypothetical protein AB7J25_29640, partial [Pseudonocardia sp.]